MTMNKLSDNRRGLPPSTFAHPDEHQQFAPGSRTWRRIVARLVLFFYAVQLFGALGSAQAAGVTPNAGAPAGQRPIMDAAANGVPIVDIAPPSAAGVSNNQFNQFNVDRNGLILNNSSGNTQTQLGGWVAGNPQLGPTPARIILNQVVSGNPSQLSGTIEVAGQKAAIVIANPNGITCDGCGFLNTDRATLAAGTPQFGANGALNGFNVGQGQLNVGAQGLNAANIEQLDLIARGIVIEGEVWGQNVNAIAGKNQVLYGTLQSVAQTGSAGAPAFAIDIKDMGGMYANQIYMVATEQGLGVNSTGRIAALQGNLTLSANGDLALKDTYAKQNLQLASSGDTVLSGQTTGEGTATIASSGSLRNTGTLFSGGALAVQAANFTDIGGQLLATGDLGIQAQQISLTGTQLTSNGNVALSAVDGDLSANGAAIAAGGNLTATASGGIVNAGGTWQATADFSLQGRSIANQGAMLAGGRLSVAAGDGTAGGLLDNSNGSLVGNTQVAITSGALHNAGGTIAGNGDLAIDTQGAALDNSGGQIVAGGDLTTRTAALTNQGGLMQAVVNVDIDTQGSKLDNSASGTDKGIVAGGTLKIVAGDVDNRSGYLASNGDQTLTLDGDLVNGAVGGASGGQVVTNGNAAITAANVTNTAGKIAAAGGVSLAATGQANNAGGTIVADGDVTLQGATLDNSAVDGTGGSIDGRNVMMTASALNNAGGASRSAADTKVSAATLDNTGGTLAAAGDLTLNVDGTYSNAGTLSAVNNLTVGADSIANSGTLNAGATLTANTGDLTNSGEISAADTVLNLSGTLTNMATGLIDGTNTTVNADTVDNTGRIYGDLLHVQAGTLNNSDTGTIAARNTLLIGANDINNTGGGLLYSLGDLAIAGSFDADLNPVGEAQQLVNGSSRIEAAGNATLAVQNLDNRNDQLVTGTQTTTVPVSKTYVQPYGSGALYDVSILGWNPDFKSKGEYVLPSMKYPFSVFGATPLQLSTIVHCNSDDGCTTPTYVYAPTNPIWAKFGITPPNLSGLTVPKDPGHCEKEDDGGVCVKYDAEKEAYEEAFEARMAGPDRQLDAAITAFNNDLASRGFGQWNQYQISSEKVTQTIVQSSSPGQIIAGGNLVITSSGSIVNDNSNIIAGGAINITGASVDNRATQGTTSIVDVGQVRYRKIEHHGGVSDSYSEEYTAWSPTTGAPQVSTFTLQSYVYQPNAADPATTRNLAANDTSPATSLNGAATVSNQDVATGARSINASLSTSTQSQLRGQTAMPALSVPDSSLFTVNQAPGATYVVETDPRFTNQQNFLSSDYYLNQLNLDPEYQLKRYGDGFAEQQLVDDQVMALTGRRYLSGYTSTQAEYQSLMDAGVAFAEQYQISPGVALSADQMALLTTDIVLLVKQTMTLPDGTTEDVLVPQVYLRHPQAGDLQPDGALIAGSDITIKTAGDLVNSGQIAADNGVTLTAGNDLVNQQGRISGQDVVASATNDLKNISGSILGQGTGSQIALSAGRDIVLQTQTITTQTAQSATTAASTRVNVDRIATIQGGDVTLDAGRDLIGQGSEVDADDDLLATAGRNLTVSAVAGSYQLDAATTGHVKGRTGYVKENLVDNQVASFNVGNNAALTAGGSGQGDVTLTGTNVSAGGSLGIQGSNVTIAAAKDENLFDVQNVGAHGYRRSMTDDQALAGGSVSAGGDLAVVATGDASGATDANGNAVPVAGSGDVHISGATLGAQNGQTAIVANNDITLDAMTTEHRTASEHYSKRTGLLSSKTINESAYTDTQQANGTVVGGNTVALGAGQDVAVVGSTVNAIGDATLTAGRDVVIAAATENRSASQQSEVKKSGLSASFKSGVSIGSASGKQSYAMQGTTVASASVSGSDVQIGAARDADVVGSNVLADSDIAINAGRNVNITAAQQSESTQSTSKYDSTSIGLEANIIGGATLYGQSNSKQNGTTTSTTSVTSLLSANGGNLTVTAGGTGTTDAAITTQGADLLAGKDVALTADRIDLQAAANSTSAASHAQSSSFTIGARPAGVIGGTLYNIADSVMASTEGTGDDRLDNALALKAGYDSYKLAGDLLQSTASDVASNITDPSQSAFGISISMGSSKSRSDSSDSATQVTGTNVQAKDIAVTARQTDIAMQGAKLQGDDVTLDAARDILLQAAANTSATQSSNKSSGASVGVTIGFGQQNGISFQLGMQQGKGKANGSETTYDNTLITATNQLKTTSGRDTALQGAQLAGNQVTMDAGRDLTIQTLQDSSHYQSEQKNSGFGISLCIPPLCAGVSSFSVSMSEQGIKHDYLSAQGQSGIAAGDGGFAINVNQATDLTAAAITSTANPGKNSFTTGSLTSRDLANTQDTSAKSSSFAGSTYFNAGASPVASSAILGADLHQLANDTALNLAGNAAARKALPKSGSEQSQTVSVISPATVTITGTDATQNEQSRQTADQLTSRDASTANGALTNTLTLQQAAEADQALQKAAQDDQAARVMGQLGQNLSKDIGTYAHDQEQLLRSKANVATDPDEAAALNAEADKWADGGIYRVGLHTAVGALTGGTDGAVGAGASAEAAPILSQLQDNLTNSLINAGMSVQDANAAAAGLTSLAAAGIGGAAGNAIGAATALNEDANNRQLHQSEYDLAEKYKKLVAGKLGISEDEAEGRIEAEILRNSDQQTADAEGGVHDYQIRSIIGCQNLNCNGYQDDPEYANHNYNSQYIAPNQAAYDLGQLQLETGLTYNQLVTNNIKNDPVGTTLAGAGLLGLGVMTGGGLPSLGLAGTGATIGIAVNGSVQVAQGQPFDWFGFGMAGITGAASSGMGFVPSILVNAGGSLAGSGIQKQNPNGAMAGAAVGTIIGYPIGAKIESGLGNVFNPWYSSEWRSVGNGISVFVPKSPIPSWTGDMVGGTFSELTGNAAQSNVENKK